MVNTKEITANGTLGHLLTPEPDRIVGNGSPPPSDHGDEERDLWADAREALSEAVALAQQDPLAAAQMLAMLTMFARTEKLFQMIRSDMIGLDIPEESLPLTLADTRAPENAIRWVSHENAYRRSRDIE